MDRVLWKVEGMTCVNCALTINKFLEKKGAKNIAVNPIDGDVSFEVPIEENTLEFAKGVESLGYKVIDSEQGAKIAKRHFLSSNLQRFWFCLPFTAILLLHMLPFVHTHSFLHWVLNPWVQLVLTLPVFIVGMRHFGRSAFKSIQNGIPNMNVLITIGSASAFIYSLAGAIFNLGHDYLFFETAATIITLVFLGNYLEDASIESTQKALKALVKSQKVMANMIAFDESHKEVILPIENTQLRTGDLVLINTGEQVPLDCKILWGDVMVNESLLTGESMPVAKRAKENLIGGSIIHEGTVKAQITAVGKDTILSKILNLVKQAQGEKPPVQQLADKISAVFVPVVLIIAALTLVVNWLVLKDFTPSLMRSIAVLVIACPCAMGLATPAAIAVGLGRAARNGILFRDAKSLELFKDIKQIVFDKTGTLTTGKFKIADFQVFDIDEALLKSVISSLEKHSNHPIAKSIALEWKINADIRWKLIQEMKGQGMFATDLNGHIYKAGSYSFAGESFSERNHSIYLSINNKMVGWVDLEDEIRSEAEYIIENLQKKDIQTILLSGDSYEKCRRLADKLGIDEVIAEKSPAEKLLIITELTKRTPTVMVGDGINDAPALAKATIGISMSEASQLAMQSATVVLMNTGLKKLPTALGLGKHTYITIKQNLFWAFFYNIIAIPVAALGFLIPTFAALVMGFSDVVLAINSARLYVRKVD